MTKTINLSWARFGRFGVIGIIPILLIMSSINDSDSWPAAVAPLLMFISLLAFFSRGWARLRQENAVRPILVTDADRIRKLLIGPVVPAAVWFVSTVLVIVAFVVAAAILGRAA